MKVSLRERAREIVAKLKKIVVHTTHKTICTTTTTTAATYMQGSTTPSFTRTLFSLSLSLSSTWCQPEPSPPHRWTPLLLTHPLSLSLAQHCPSYSLIHLNRVSLVRFSLFYYSLQWIRRSGWVSCWELVAKNCSGQEKPLHAKLGRIFVNLFKGASKRWQ